MTPRWMLCLVTVARDEAAAVALDAALDAACATFAQTAPLEGPPDVDGRGGSGVACAPARGGGAKDTGTATTAGDWCPGLRGEAPRGLALGASPLEVGAYDLLRGPLAARCIMPTPELPAASGGPSRSSCGRGEIALGCWWCGIGSGEAAGRSPVAITALLLRTGTGGPFDTSCGLGCGD